MKCTNCGNELEADALFCTNCGHKVEADVNMSAQPNYTAQPNSGAAQPNYTAQPNQNTQTQMQKPKKKIMGKVIGGAAVVAVIAAAAVFLFGNGGKSDGKGNEKALVYYKDDALYYTSNMDKEDSSVKVCEVKNDNGSGFVEYDIVDGYLYFYSRISSDGAATLNRIALKDIKKDTDKTEKNIQEIDTNIEDWDLINDTDHLVYQKQNGKLIYLDGKDELDIARDVTYYKVADDEQCILYSQTSDSVTSMHVYDLKTGKDELLYKGDMGYSISDRSDFIIYKTNQDDETIDLYVADNNGRNDKIDTGIEGIVGQNSQDKKVYYVKSRKESANAYSYVDDVYADADAALNNPQVRDYLESCTRDDVFSAATYGYDNDEKIDFYDYYNDDLDDFLYWWMEYDSDLGLYYGDYKVENDTYAYFYYDELTNQWYKLKSEEYDTARKQYDQAASRIELREELKDTDLDTQCYDLYLWEDGKDPQMIAENINTDYVVASLEGNLVVYKKNDMTTQKISMDDIDSVYDVTDMVSNGTHYAQENDPSYYYAGGEEKELDLDGRVTNLSMTEDQKNVMIESSQGDVNELDLYTISGSELKSKDSLGADTCSAAWTDNDTCYYFKDIDSGYGDLYSYHGGKSQKILSNVYANVSVFEDGNYVYSKNYEDKDLRIKTGSKDKDEIKVTNSADKYTYINEKRIVYKRDDNLYVYTGKDEDTRIARNVYSYQCEVQADCTYVCAW